MNVHELLLLMSLNHLMTELVFFHWLISKNCLSGELMLSRVDLLIFPISLFDGLMRRQVGLERKFSLWSFMVMNASGFARMSTRSSIPNSVVIVLASRLISSYRWS